MRAFIIRPFGIQGGVDFDAVERQLIGPALDRLHASGRTTIDILKQGNIRVDMFQRLLTADLVVADLSIHNANVFYELGIRHALRDKRTFLLRANIDKYPFDLQTDRYFVYNEANPAECLEAFIAALRQTLDSEDQDSPVFKLLPDLAVQDRARFLIVPPGFREEVERAVAARQRGDLRLLAAEARGFEWESEGLRVVGRAQFNLKAYEAARETWETVREFDERDLEANVQLGTVYQKLNDLTRSDHALQRALDRKDLARAQRAEVHALLGRNAKVRWKAAWSGVAKDSQRSQALRSAFLDDCLAAYASAFNQDLNHFYSGVNALAMQTILFELATAMPEIWAERFDSEADATRELALRQEQVRRLAAAVELSLQSDRLRSQREDRKDLWVEIGLADLLCLTSKRPLRVAGAYRDALADAPDFAIDSVHDQLVCYRQLGVLAENVQAALPALPPPSAAEFPAGAAPKLQRVLIFTGHMIDAPSRATPRFPPSKEDAARQMIKEAVEGEMRLPEGVAFGIAGGASGGDMLFHEICAEKGIATRLYLALPRDQFVSASVQSAGPDWITRFYKLCRQNPPRILGDSEQLPRWLREKPDYNIWQRNNLWMLYNAMAEGAENVTLIALWNGEAGDGPGGAKDLVQQATSRGAKTVILDTRQWL